MRTQSGPLREKPSSWKLIGKRPLGLPLLFRFRRCTFSTQCLTWNRVYPWWRWKSCFSYLRVCQRWVVWDSGMGSLQVTVPWQCLSCVSGGKCFCELGDPTSALPQVWKLRACLHESCCSLGSLFDDIQWFFLLLVVHQGVYFSLVPWTFKKDVVWITNPEYKPAGKYTFCLLQPSVAALALYDGTFESFRSTSGISVRHPTSSHWHVPRRSDLCFSPLFTLTVFRSYWGKQETLSSCKEESHHTPPPTSCLRYYRCYRYYGKSWLCPLALVVFSVPPTSKRADRMCFLPAKGHLILLEADNFVMMLITRVS